MTSINICSEYLTIFYSCFNLYKKYNNVRQNHFFYIANLALTHIKYIFISDINHHNAMLNTKKSKFEIKWVFCLLIIITAFLEAEVDTLISFLLWINYLLNLLLGRLLRNITYYILAYVFISKSLQIYTGHDP